MPTITTKIAQTRKWPNIAESYGPFASLQAAMTYVENADIKCAGLTVGIDQPDGSIKEYWLKPVEGQLQFVEKQEAGQDGQNAYVHIRYAAQMPTSDNDMHTTPQAGDKYVGFYGGNSATAPTAYNSYVWSEYVGADGQDGQNAMNPFKGWFDADITGEAGSRVTDDTVNLPTNPVVGDYAYVKTLDISGTAPSQTETPIVKIYECSTAGTWSDSGRTFNPENNQEFASGENLNEVFIESVPSSNSNNLVKSGGVKAELEKKARYSYSADGEGFMISDPSGYVVLQVDSEGNIITKNFNSSSVSSQHSQAPDSYKELIIGTFQRGTINQDNTITTSTTSIVTDTLAIPYEGAKLIVSLNEGYVLKVKCGFVDGDHGTRYPLAISGTFTDGDVIELPLTGTYSGSVFDVASMRFEVSKSDNSEITVAEGGNLKLFYKDQCSLCDADESLIQDIQIKAAKLGTGTNPVLNYNDKVVLVHGSDIHSDYTRLSLLYEVANSINADAVLLTGDIVMHNYHDGVTPMVELAGKSSVPTLICVGNHEVGFHYGNDNFEVTDSGVFDYLFADMPNLQNYLSGVGTTTQVPYYYYDIADKKLRIISIYQYVSGAQTAQSGYNNLRWAIHFDATELSWFVNVLSNTPNDYGIVLLMHTPELSQNAGKIVDNDLFFSSYYDFGNTQTSISGGYVLRDIVDAFISRSSLSKAYTQGGTPSSITVSADFSSVDSSVEFIGVINGHYHQDAIGLISGAQERQVQLNIACTSSVRQQARKFDCIRNSKNNTGSAFNVYVLDRANNNIEIYRIGTHKTIDGRNRTQMTIAYK